MTVHDQGDAAVEGNDTLVVPSGRIGGGNAGVRPTGSVDLSHDAGTWQPTGVLGATPFCAPTNCEDRAATCGTLADGCGGVIVCGICQTGEICQAGTHACVAQADLCQTAGLECGAALDACGAAVACGICEGGNVCDATSGSCGPCEPRTCETLSACGEIPDGCGGTLDCGGCGDDTVCDGIARQCLPCEPTTCEAEGTDCGVISDGCGDALNCDDEIGGCGDGLACLDHRCRPINLALECDLQMANCGQVIHSCSGEAVACGQCPDGETCIENRWEVCVPRTCDELELECGNTDDGCGGTLSCGDCPQRDEDDNRLTCHNNVCCSPMACPDDACGRIADGCGGTVDCNSCPTAGDGQEQVCGLVTANVCTPCTRLTCEPSACGRVRGGDGCGDRLDCGSCPQDGVADGERNVCSLTANVCELCIITKTTCDPGECGRISDGCGDRIDCGGCPTGEVCGLVTANVCTPCTPTKTSCDADDCGDVSNGCGGQLDCGGCADGKQCGLVTANVCSVCTPRECPGNLECGVVTDGCGDTTNCGSCSDSGDACIDNLCCKPKTCGDPGVGCDTEDDGCGGTLDCSCQNGLVCDASGGCCRPKSCLEECLNGDYNGDDGCGNPLHCLDCSGPPL